MAQGLTPYSKNEEIEVVRIIHGRPAKLTVNMVDLASLPRKNIQLLPKDIVYVGATKSKNNDRNLGKSDFNYQYDYWYCRHHFGSQEVNRNNTLTKVTDV